jgi:hypothetical protein
MSYIFFNNLNVILLTVGLLYTLFYIEKFYTRGQEHSEINIIDEESSSRYFLESKTFRLIFRIKLFCLILIAVAFSVCIVYVLVFTNL